MSNIQVFSFKGQHVRTEEFGGEVWFCVRDVGSVLGLKRASEMCRKYLRRDELRTVLSSTKSTKVDAIEEQRAIRRRILFTNESGMYTMILRSEKKEAQEFRHWVTNEVLPSIRRTGSYNLPLLSGGESKETRPVPMTMSGNIVTEDVSFTYSYALRESLTGERLMLIRSKIDDLINAVSGV